MRPALAHGLSSSLSVSAFLVLFSTESDFSPCPNALLILLAFLVRSYASHAFSGPTEMPRPMPSSSFPVPYTMKPDAATAAPATASGGTTMASKPAENACAIFEPEPLPSDLDSDSESVLLLLLLFLLVLFLLDTLSVLGFFGLLGTSELLTLRRVRDGSGSDGECARNCGCDADRDGPSGTVETESVDDAGKDCDCDCDSLITVPVGAGDARYPDGGTLPCTYSDGPEGRVRGNVWGWIGSCGMESESYSGGLNGSAACWSRWGCGGRAFFSSGRPVYVIMVGEVSVVGVYGGEGLGNGLMSLSPAMIRNRDAQLVQGNVCAQRRYDALSVENHWLTYYAIYPLGHDAFSPTQR